MEQILKKKSKEESIRRIKALQGYFSETAWEIGKELNSIKEQCEHGEFEKIVRENFDFSLRYAEIFMKVNKAFKSEMISDLGIARLMELLKIEDEEERQEFTEIVLEKEELPTMREMREEIKEFRAFKADKNGNFDYRLTDLDLKTRQLNKQLEMINSNIQQVNFLLSGIMLNNRQGFNDYIRKDAIKKQMEEINKKLNGLERINNNMGG